MLTPSLLALLLATTTTTTLATTTLTPLDSNPYSKFISDANALLAAATGTAASQLSALYAWQATQTAIPSPALNAQYQSYLDAYMTTTSVALPPWITAVPSSLQPAASSFLQAEASLVVQDIAPIVSEFGVGASTTTAAAGSTSKSITEAWTVVPATPTTTASAGFGTGVANANATMAQGTGNGTVQTTAAANGTASVTSITTASGSPTKSVTPPVTTFPPGSGAEKKSAGVAVVAALVAVMGMMVLL